MRSNKLRTFLTVLGIMIGIAGIIIVYSAGEGIRSLLLAQMDSLGNNIVQTEIKVPTAKKGNAGDTQSAMALASGVQITSLKLKDLEDIKKLDNVGAGYAAIMTQDKVSHEAEVHKTFVFGVNPEYLNVDKSKIALGEFFTDDQNNALDQVVVLGSTIKEKLFGDSDAVGNYISFHSAKYKVIGVMAKKGAVMTFDFDSMVYVPIKTLQKKVLGVDYVSYMVTSLIDNKRSADTAEQIRSLLRINHDISDPTRDDFRVSTMDDFMKTLDTVMGALTWLLLAIVVISLLVGGVGILNIMYVVVSERTSEIGLRKAVGATYSNIMNQFLVESAMISLLGALVGVAFGVLLSWLIAVGANMAGFDWTFVVPARAFVVSIAFSLICGVFFGVYPARKAAALDPVEALRKE